jgi:hypothetical protein
MIRSSYKSYVGSPTVNNFDLRIELLLLDVFGNVLDIVSDVVVMAATHSGHVGERNWS